MTASEKLVITKTETLYIIPQVRYISHKESNQVCALHSASSRGYLDGQLSFVYRYRT
jgi:hypothetical protein